MIYPGLSYQSYKSIFIIRRESCCVNIFNIEYNTICRLQCIIGHSRMLCLLSFSYYTKSTYENFKPIYICISCTHLTSINALVFRIFISVKHLLDYQTTYVWDMVWCIFCFVFGFIICIMQPKYIYVNMFQTRWMRQVIVWLQNIWF